MIKCALSLTPFLEQELPQLRFELVTKGEIVQTFDSTFQRKRDTKLNFKEGGRLASNKLAELVVHVADWKSKDLAFQSKFAEDGESKESYTTQ